MLQEGIGDRHHAVAQDHLNDLQDLVLLRGPGDGVGDEPLPRHVALEAKVHGALDVLEPNRSEPALVDTGKQGLRQAVLRNGLRLPSGLQERGAAEPKDDDKQEERGQSIHPALSSMREVLRATRRLPRVRNSQTSKLTRRAAKGR